MRRPPARIKLLLASLLALPLALLSGAQALSSAALRTSPERALVLFPWNGLASEKVAYRQLARGVAKAAGLGQIPGTAAAAPVSGLPQGADLARFAAAAGGTARNAIRREPLVPRAYLLLALAERDPAKRTALVEATSQLTRRDPVLQVLVLEERGKAKNFIGAINTLDEILRVRPERRDEFFPVLVKALGEERAVPGLARLMARPLPWRESFLNFAVADGSELDNLATVRERITLDDPEFDRKLIYRLAESGNIAAAARIYALVAPSRAGATGMAGWGSWKSQYPPFDWQLADQAGFRAQLARESDKLEVAINPGNGGVVATRLLPNPRVPFVLRMTGTIEPASQAGDLKLAVACAGQDESFAETLAGPSETSLAIGSTPACPYVAVSITARAWTGGRAVDALFAPLQITTARR